MRAAPAAPNPTRLHCGACSRPPRGTQPNGFNRRIIEQAQPVVCQSCNAAEERIKSSSPCTELERFQGIIKSWGMELVAATRVSLGFVGVEAEVCSGPKLY